MDTRVLVPVTLRQFAGARPRALAGFYGLGEMGLGLFPGEVQQFTTLVDDLKRNDLNAVLRDIVIHNQPQGTLQDSDIPALIPQYAGDASVKSWLPNALRQAATGALVDPPWPNAGPYQAPSAAPPPPPPTAPTAPTAYQSAPTPAGYAPLGPSVQPPYVAPSPPAQPTVTQSPYSPAASPSFYTPTATQPSQWADPLGSSYGGSATPGLSTTSAPAPAPEGFFSGTLFGLPKWLVFGGAGAVALVFLRRRRAVS